MNVINIVIKHYFEYHCYYHILRPPLRAHVDNRKCKYVKYHIVLMLLDTLYIVLYYQITISNNKGFSVNY